MYIKGLLHYKKKFTPQEIFLFNLFTVVNRYCIIKIQKGGAEVDEIRNIVLIIAGIVTIIKNIYDIWQKESEKREKNMKKRSRRVSKKR